MKLFAIRLPDGSLVTNTKGEPVYFDGKKEAKRVRDRINEHEYLHSVHGKTPRKGGATIVLGPDHFRY